MPADSSESSRAERIAVWLLLAISGVALAVRALAVAEPLGIDQSLWASAARGMWRGQALYRDVWEQRPPSIYFTYLSAFVVLGWREATVTWLDLIASAITTFLIFDIARLLAGRLTGAVAVACYVVLTMPASLYSHGGFLERSVSETFTSMWIAAAAAAAVRLVRGSLRVGLLSSVLGLAIGVAVTFKPNAGLYLPAFACWIWCYRASRPSTFFAKVSPFVVMSFAAMTPTVVTIMWLGYHGLLADARVAVVDFNRFYVASGVTFDALGLAFAKAVWLRVKTDPLWATGAVGAMFSTAALVRTRRLSPLPGLAVLWGGAAAFVILVNGIRLFNSYFINAHVPLSIMAAWMLAGSGSAAWLRWFRVAIAALVVGMLIARGFVPRVLESARADWGALTGAIDRATYLERFGGYANSRGYSARANEELATYIAAHSSPDETVFLFGINGAGVYFLADRPMAHRFIRANFFVPEVFPNPAFTRAAVIADLERVRPRYVIFERLHTASEVGREIDALPGHPVVAPWLESHYDLETTIEDFAVYRRR